MQKICCFLMIMFLSIAAHAAVPNFPKIFRGKNACFILYDLSAHKTLLEYNKQRCNERVFACSTFKIPLAIMAFDQGILQNENTVIKWDGVDRKYPSWNQDQTPKTWLQNSTVWVSQWLTPQIGMEKIKKYLAAFSYGNQDMSGGISKAWLSSSLKISAAEQVRFLKNFWQASLPVTSRAIALTKKILPMEVSAHGDILYGKTGSGFIDGRDDPSSRMLGWYVGVLMHNNHHYIFATNATDLQRNTNKSFIIKAISPGETAKAFTKEILRELQLFGG